MGIGLAQGGAGRSIRPRSVHAERQKTAALTGLYAPTRAEAHYRSEATRSRIAIYRRHAKTAW